MNANEKIYVAGFWCESTEDNYETGEDPNRRGAAWGNTRPVMQPATMPTSIQMRNP